MCFLASVLHLETTARLILQSVIGYKFSCMHFTSTETVILLKRRCPNVILSVNPVQVAGDVTWFPNTTPLLVSGGQLGVIT